MDAERWEEAAMWRSNQSSWGIHDSHRVGAGVDADMEGNSNGRVRKGEEGGRAGKRRGEMGRAAGSLVGRGKGPKWPTAGSVQQCITSDRYSSAICP